MRPAKVAEQSAALAGSVGRIGALRKQIANLESRAAALREELAGVEGEAFSSLAGFLAEVTAPTDHGFPPIEPH